MESPRTASLRNDLKKANEELVRGRESAKQLQILLQEPLGLGDRDQCVSAKDLVAKIVRSFTNTLSVLNSGETGDLCRTPVITPVSSPSSDERKEDSGESRKIPASKDRRGGYKRRKMSQTWTEVTSTPIEDGFAWRKYGQKEILNSKFPRSYFRCTHKNDQGCQAIKQVQRTEDDPVMYRTTYMGHHTCTETLKAPQLILDSSPKDEYLLNFQSNSTSKQGYPFRSSFPSIKQECNDQTTQNHSSSDYLLSPDLTTFESSGPATMLASTPGSDHGDVISGVYWCTSSQSLDMGLVVGSVDFDDVFHFDEDFFKA